MKGESADGQSSSAVRLFRRNGDLSPRPQKTAALLAQHIVARISSRRLQPGDMLPPEREMLAEYSVGRGTLREALRFLEMQGVITIRPGSGGGPAVAAPDSRALAGSLSIVLQFARGRFRSIVETRKVIEPAVAAAAARNVTPEYLAEIRKSVRDMADNLEDPQVFWQENSRFHDLIAWASGNTVFGFLLSSLHWIDDGSAMGVQYPAWARKVVLKAHQRIVDAIASGDAEAAEKRMLGHVEEYQRYLEENYPQLLDEVIRWDRLT